MERGDEGEDFSIPMDLIQPKSMTENGENNLEWHLCRPQQTRLDNYVFSIALLKLIRF